MALLATKTSPQKQGYSTFHAPQDDNATLKKPNPTQPLVAHSDAPWLSQLLFAYASPLLATGNTRQLDQDDLWELEDQYKTSNAFQTFKRAYLKCDKSVLQACVKTYGAKFWWCGLGSLTMAGCALFAPAVLHQVIDGFSAPTVDMANLSVWIGAFFASRLVNAFVQAHVNFHTEMTMLQLSGSIKAMVFEKAMRRSMQSKNDNADTVEVTNLYTSDIENLMYAGYMLNSVWIMPIKVAAVIYMLYNVLDLAAFAGLAMIFVSMYINYLLANAWSKAYSDIMGHKDRRMKAVKEMFNAIQVIKLNAWESKFADRIRAFRLLETNAIAKYLNLMAVFFLAMWSAPLLVSVTSFVAYALVLNKELTAAKVFTSMVLFNAIRSPLSQFPEAIQAVVQGRFTIQRVSKYLAAEEVDPGCVARDGTKYPANVEISVEDATFKWRSPPPAVEQKHSGDEERTSVKTEQSPRDNKPVLQNVSFQVRKGDFVVVHGAVGAGKSSLFAALLGELPSESGKVFVRAHDIAYYSQQPWIQNMTIRDNILFGLPYDKTKYDRVMDACGLVKDVTMFPAGDNTEIGQKGINLSGGQKARVALARACYSDAEVYILDAPLAAVDAIVQAEIFNKCLCGLLEKKTVILVTHIHDIIASEAANVKILIKDGQATVSYGDRKKTRREYANLHTEKAVQQPTETDKGTIDNDGKVHKTPVSGALIQAETRKNGRVSIDVFLAYVRASGGWNSAVVFLFVLVTWQSLQVGSDVWMSQWTSDKAAVASRDSVVFNLSVYVVLGLATACFVMIRAQMMATLGIRAACNLFDGMTKSLLHAPLRFFDANPIGRVLNRYSEDTTKIDYILPFQFFGMLVATATNVFQLATAIYVIRWAGIFIIPLGYIYVQVGKFFVTASREVARLMKTSTSPILSHLAQSEEGVVTLRAYGQSYVDRTIAENAAHNDTNNRVWYAQTVVSQWFAVRMEMVGFGIVVLVVSTLMVLHEYLTPGLVGLAFMYAVSIDQRLGTWVNTWSRLESSMVSPERVLEYVAIQPEGHASDRLVVTSGSTGGEWPQRGALTFEKVKFAYKPGGDLVLKGLSFQVNHNEKIGIVGRTGAGKSSLTMALFRINELVSGRILLDGVDISTVNLQTLRSRMSIIPQVPVLFKGSMRAYMDPFEEYSDAEIWMAFDKMGMKQMISDLDGKLQHELSENGENFSVGERQMLCLARALLRKSRVIIMDEATASIDVATEKKLQEMITREFVDATVLTIAHRLATVLESDRILVISDGRVAEFDTPRQLARMKGGVFRGLAKEGGYLPQLLG